MATDGRGRQTGRMMGNGFLEQWRLKNNRAGALEQGMYEWLYDRRRRWDEDETRESGQSTQLPRSHYGRQRWGEAWSGQVCVLWHQDAASSWISLTRPSVWRQAFASLTGMAHLLDLGPAALGGHGTTKKMHSGGVQAAENGVDAVPFRKDTCVCVREKGHGSLYI
jgi:hypothetical protein